MSNLKTKIIDNIIAVEGGYVNDPSDSGGETNYGITKEVALENNYTDDMEVMPVEVARKIYEDRYWEPLHLTAIEKMSIIIAEELADTGVNMGINRAGKFLQRALTVLNNRGHLYPDLHVDGQIGPQTLRALSEFLAHRGLEGENVLFKMLNALQGAFYVELTERREKNERFIYGWFKNRVA